MFLCQMKDRLQEAYTINEIQREWRFNIMFLHLVWY